MSGRTVRFDESEGIPKTDRHTSWRQEVGTGKSRQEVVQRLNISQIDNLDPQSHLLVAKVNQIVYSCGDIDGVANRDSWRMCVVIFGSGRRNTDSRRAHGSGA